MSSDRQTDRDPHNGFRLTGRAVFTLVLVVGLVTAGTGYWVGAEHAETTAAAAEDPQPERVEILMNPHNDTVSWHIHTTGEVVIAVSPLNRTANKYGYIEYNATECTYDNAGCYQYNGPK